MEHANHLPAERMTGEQRRQELGAILALGLIRLRQSKPINSQIHAAKREVVLGFSGDQSVHTDHVNNRKTESQCTPQVATMSPPPR